MLLSNEKLLNDAPGLSQLTQKSLPVRVSYAITKNIAKIESNLKIYNKEKEKLIDKYSAKDEHGNVIVDEKNNVIIQNELLSDCDKEFNELKEIENEIYIHKFKMSELINSGVHISPGELMIMDYMIEED